MQNREAAQISAPFRRYSSKVNRADFSARRGFRRYSSKVTITPDKKLPKLNLAGPDGIPQIGGKGDNKSI